MNTGLDKINYLLYNKPKTLKPNTKETEKEWK